jgi:hypothetical protein
MRQIDSNDFCHFEKRIGQIDLIVQFAPADPLRE